MLKLIKERDVNRITCIFVFALLSLPVLASGPALAWNINQNAAIVLGQPDMISDVNNNGGVSASSLSAPTYTYSDGTRLFVADYQNSRVLIYNSIPASNNAAADVVVGQPDMTSNAANNGGIGANTLYQPMSVYSDGTKLFIADTRNHRVLIYNTIPTSNNASADVVLGQPNMTSNTNNNGGRDAGSISFPMSVYSYGTKLIVTDSWNHRVLIYNTIPTTNNADADVVIGQPDMTSGADNNGGLDAGSLYIPYSACTAGSKLVVTDTENHRVLIFNTIPTSNNASADVVLGQADMTGLDANKGAIAPDAASLALPYGAYEAGTKLVVTDTSNNRVVIYYQPPAITDNQTGSNTMYSADPGGIFDVDFNANANLNNVQYTVYSAAAMGGVQLKAWTDIATGINAANYTANWGVDWASLQNGTNYVSVRAYDYAGNVSAVSQDVFYVKRVPLGGLCGDIDEDGRIRSKDLVLLKQHVAGTIATPLTISQLAKADIALRATGNTDGNFDATDVALLADTITDKCTTAQLKCPANP